MSYTRQSILYINGLDKSVNENMLYQLFNDFPISYIKIAKDHTSRESFGYAFVGFKNHSKAEEALIKLNYSRLGKKSIRISWYNRDPNNMRNKEENNIFIKRLPGDVTHHEFHDYFSKYGNIVSAKLAEDEDGETLGFGFVLYDNSEACKEAISDANGKIWKGKKMFVGQFVKNRPKIPPKFNNIYVKNIPKSFSEEEIKKYFSKYGDFGSIIINEPDPKKLDSKIPEDKRNQIVSHKYAFICFKNFDSAERAVNEVPYYKISNKIYNQEIDKIVEILSKNGFEKNLLHKCSAYILENIENYTRIFQDNNFLSECLEEFKKHLQQNDNNYIVRDKEDRMDCCQALKKKDRIRKLKQLYERIKKQIKEKYRFCNLYVKNLPDGMDDVALRKLFEKYGEIKSCKAVRKELYTSYLGIKRSVRVFGFVCFSLPEYAREAKNALHGSVLNNNTKLYVDYHQTRQERQEFLKLKFINQKGPQMKMKGIDRNVRQLPNPVFGPHMLRKFPPQTSFKPIMQMEMLDINARRDYYGERLYTKISSSHQFMQYSELFSKIVGIFLDLDNNIIDRLIEDEHYFYNQVVETIRLLAKK